MSRKVKLPKPQREPCTSQSVSPIAHYKMNDDADSTTVIDSMGNYNGTATRNTSDLTATGKINEALEFNGTSDKVVATGLNLDVDSDFSGSLWIYPTGADGTFISSRIDDDNGIRGFWNNDGTISITVKKGGTAYVKSLSGNSVNQWHHVCFAWDSSTDTLDMWIDFTAPDGTDGPWFIGDSGTDLTLGARVDDDIYFVGYIDDVRIYNRLLTLEGVEQIYKGGEGTEAEQIAGNHLVGAWGFNNGLGFKDSSGQGNDGTPSGGVTLAKNGGFEFVNTGGKVDIGTPLNTFPITLMAWVKTTDTSGAPISVLGNYRSGSFNGVFIFLISGRLKTWYFSGPDSNADDFTRQDNDAVDGGFIADGVWHFITYTVDSSGGKIYVDGELINSAGVTGTLATSTSTEDFTIGDISTYSNFIGSVRETTMHNAALSPAEIKQIYQAGVPSDSEDLVLHVTDGTEDLSVYNTEISNTDVVVGDKMLFNGSSSELNLGDQSRFDFVTTDSFTVNMWIKPDNTSEEGYLLAKWTNGGAGWGLYWYGTANVLRIYSGGAGAFQSSDTCDSFANQWRMVTWVYNNGTMYFYENGESRGSDEIEISSGTGIDMKIGNRAAGSIAANYYNGKMDDVRIYSGTKSPAWVKQYYERSKKFY